MPDPPPNENTRSVESQARPLSKDEQIDRLEQALKRCVDSEGGTSIDAIPILLFLAEALNQDDPMILRLDGMDIDYCNSGAAVTPILRWLASKLHVSHNEIDEASLSFVVDMNRRRRREEAARAS
jgi:hypothetical protein